MDLGTSAVTCRNIGVVVALLVCLDAAVRLCHHRDVRSLLMCDV